MNSEKRQVRQYTQDTDRKKRELEAARRISEALFQYQKIEDLVGEALQTALDIVNAEAGSVLLANPETKELVFYHSIGQSPVKPGTSIPWTQGIAGSVFQSGTPLVSADVKTDSRHFRGVDETTGITTHDLIAIPLKRWEGESLGVLEVLNKRDGQLDEQDVDILSIISAFTALSIEQARLFQEGKIAEVVRVLGDVGHDIKNMLMPVLHGASLLGEELHDHFSLLKDGKSPDVKATEATSQHLIKMIEKNARRIQERVREIADAVKGVTSPPRFAPCRIFGIVATVKETLAYLAKEKGISLRTKGLEDLPIIQADEHRLFNAFYNLINNAIPEVPAGGTISVEGRFEESDQAVLLSVADTGKGMKPEIRDRLFTSRAVSTKPGGTGLGTKIVRDVVTSHGGSIFVESQEGVGTTFHIRLPLDPPTGPSR
jgi:signal transduction histidine kinase